MSLLTRLFGKPEKEIKQLGTESDKKTEPAKPEPTGTTLRSPAVATRITQKKPGPELTAQQMADKQQWEVKTLPVWQAGDVILDTYEIEAVISGGMGHVYIAHHKNWNVKVAIKSPNEMMLSDREFFARILREANSWTELGLHPNIAYCYYVRNIDDIPHIFIEFVDGGNLKQWIEEGKCIDYRTSLDLAIQFCHGMEHAHSKGMIHRDIKPENILMTQDSILKITDFGLVKGGESSLNETALIQGRIQERDSSLTGVGDQMGTWDYMSPEQRENPHEVDERTDIFSFGICLYEMFCGNRPYEITFGPEQEPPNPASLSGDPNFPIEMGTALTKSVQWKRSKRFDSFSDIKKRLLHIYHDLFGEESPYAELDDVDLEADGLNNRGVSYFELGRKEEAVACWENALEASKIHPEATYNLSLIHWRDSRIDDREMLKRLDDCKENQAVNKERYSELKAFVHAERWDLDAARDALKAFPGKFNDIFVFNNDVGEIKHDRSLLGHSEAFISSICISNNGQLAVSGRADGSLWLWNLESGQCLRKLGEHTRPPVRHPVSICISPDCRFSVSGSWDKTVGVWEMATGRCMHMLEGHADRVVSVSLSPDGRFVASGAANPDKTMRIWDLEKGQCVRTMEEPDSFVRAIAFTPDGRQVVSAAGKENGVIRIWEFKTGRCLRTLEGPKVCEGALSITPDGDHAVIGSSSECQIYVLNLESGKIIRKMRVPSVRPITKTDISSYNDFIISISDDESGAIRVWDLNTGQCIRTLEGFPNSASAVCLSPDGRYVIAGTHQDTLQVYRTSFDKHFKSAMIMSFPKGFNEIKMERDRLHEAVRLVVDLYDRGNYSESYSTLMKAWKEAGNVDHPEVKEQYHQLRKKGRAAGLSYSFLRGMGTGHTELVHSVCTCPDSPLGFSVSADGTLRLWDLQTGQFVRSFKGYAGAVAISNDGRHVVSAGKTIRVWDFKTGQCTRKIEGHAWSIRSVAFTPDGRHAVFGCDENNVRLWDLQEGVCVHRMEGHLYGIDTAVITPDGRFAVTKGNEEDIYQWDLQTGQHVRKLEGPGGKVTAISITSDGCHAVLGRVDKTVQFWNLQTGKCDQKLEGHEKAVTAVAITLDGRYAVAGDQDQTLCVWDLKTGSCTHRMAGHASTISTIRITPDSRFAISRGDENMVYVWDLQAGRLFRKLEGHEDVVTSICISPDGRVVISGSDDKTLRLWDIKTGQCLKVLEAEPVWTIGSTPNRVKAVSISPDGRYAVSGSSDHAVRVWDLHTGECVNTINGFGEEVNAVCFSPDNRRIVSGYTSDYTNRGAMYVCEPDTESFNQTMLGPEFTTQLSEGSISSNGRYLVTGNNDYTLRVLNMETGQWVQRIEGSGDTIESVCIGPDNGFAISGCHDNTVQVWDLKTGRCLRTLKGHNSFVKSVCISTDGLRALSASWDHTLKWWNLETGECIHTLNGHTAYVNSVSITSDSRFAISGGWDKIIRVWDLQTGECLRTLEGHTGHVNSVSVSPDGLYAISGSDDKTVRIWELIWDLEFD